MYVPSRSVGFGSVCGSMTVTLLWNASIYQTILISIDYEEQPLHFSLGARDPRGWHRLTFGRYHMKHHHRTTSSHEMLNHLLPCLPISRHQHLLPLASTREKILKYPPAHHDKRISDRRQPETFRWSECIPWTCTYEVFRWVSWIFLEISVRDVSVPDNEKHISVSQESRRAESLVLIIEIHLWSFSSSNLWYSPSQQTIEVSCNMQYFAYR